LKERGALRAVLGEASYILECREKSAQKQIILRAEKKKERGKTESNEIKEGGLPAGSIEREHFFKKE